MLEIAKCITDLDTTWFKHLLTDLGNHDAANKLTSVEAKAIGTGQMGFVAKANLHYESSSEQAPASLIIKLSSPDENARQTGLALGIYQAEVNFYKEIAPNINMQLTPCLYANVDDAGWLTIVLKDFSAVAQQGDVLVGGTIEQAKLAITELTKLQAPFWNSEEWLAKPWLNPVGAAPLYDIPPVALAPFLDRFGHAFSEQIADVFRRVFPKSKEWFANWQQPLSITHGDFRLDNILVAATEDAPAITTIDWQTVKMGPPLMDVAYYLGVCITTEERREHERDILKHYQSELLRRGVDYPWDQLWESYRFCALYGVLLCAFAVRVPQTPRGDEMFVLSATRYAQMAIDLDAISLIP